jgi:hypothetical protein
MDVIDEFAPGLRMLPHTLGGLHWPPDIDLPSLAANPSQALPLVAVGGGAYLMACFAVRGVVNRHRERVSGRQGKEDKVWKPRRDNTTWLRRQWWKVSPPLDSMRVDGLWLPRTGAASHCLWLAPTGGGKSTAVAELRFDGARPALAIMPDISDPLRARADFVWTAGQSETPIDFLIGTAEAVAQRLTEAFRSGGQGVWKRVARRWTAQAISILDQGGIPRSLKLIGESLDKLTAQAGREVRQACAMWIERYLDLADQMGGSMAAGGVDLAELLNRGLRVVLDNDAMGDSALGADVVALGLAEAKRIESMVRGGFRLIFEEALQLKERIDLCHPFLLAGRRRRIAVDLLAQSEDGLDSIITQNARTKVYFSQETTTLQRQAADRLGIPYGELDPGAMDDFTAWVNHGRIRRLVRFPKPKKQRSPAAGGVSSDLTGGSVRVERGIVVTEVPRWQWQSSGEPVTYAEPWRKEPLALPGPSIRMQELIDGSVRDGTHLRWRPKGWNGPDDKGERHDRDGYGEIWIPGENYRKVHRVRYELAYGGIPRRENGQTMTVQHAPDCPKDCFELGHLSLLTREANSRDSHTSMRRKIRRKAGGSGGNRGKGVVADRG